MAQPALRPTNSRSRLSSRSGLTSSRSGERLHLGGENSHSIGTARGKLVRATTANPTTGSFSKVTTGNEKKRPALIDKTNSQTATHELSEYSQGKLHQEPLLKHKAPSSVALRTTTTTANSKPRSASVTSHTSIEASGSSNYNNARHQRGVSSSSAVNAVKKSRGGALKTSSDMKMEVEDQTISSTQRSSIAANVTTTTKRASAGSRSTMQSIGNGMDVEDAALLSHRQEQGENDPTASQTELYVGSYTNLDEDMSEVESDWPSSSAESSSRRHSSKTDAEEDDFGIKATVMNPDEEIEVEDEEEEGEEEEEEEDDEDEDDDSGAESVILDNLDPECYVSLPPEMELLAQAKVAHICARFEELVLRPAMMKQAVERQAAMERGEIAPEIAAHDDELALMGLDPDEVRDTSMVAEYSKEIFEYMSRCEARTMANPNYMDFQGEIRWHMRATLVDWLMQVHMRYHMMPETLWIAINIVDRFLSARVVSLAKLQLVGVTAMFVAAKYEEILAPSVDEFVFMTESGYTREEILKGERIVLSTLNFNVSSYCSPYSWVRRISKADDYDLQTRTLAKFLMELTLFDHRFLRAKPSLIAATAMYLSKKMLGGQWNESFVYYSNLIEEQLIPGANLLLEKLIDENFLDCFVCKKYGNRKFLKASIYARDWALRNHQAMGALLSSTHVDNSPGQ
ncbi:hypothetical protein CBS101457_001336 [Exobasidium rhododendri]|nr:hypothetical protein CBS101457_001336 [Exobasidium rhododendri]